MLCEWQQNEICYGFAYNIYHLAGEDKNKSLEGGCSNVLRVVLKDAMFQF